VDDTPAYLPLAPDLVVEVLSPSDSSSEVEFKVEQWLELN
jgi:Uma2 family endonuclease